MYNTRATKIIGFSVPPVIATEIEEVAQEECRTKSELFREMFRLYKRYREQQAIAQGDWLMDLIAQTKEEQKVKPMAADALLKESKKLIKYGSGRAKTLGIKSKDVDNLIYEYRKQRKST